MLKCFSNKAERYISLKLGNAIELPANDPLQLVEANALKQRRIDFLQLVSGAEEMDGPEEPSGRTGPEHSVDVEHQEMKQSRRNPVAEDVHGVDDVKRFVEERKPPRNAYVPPLSTL